jgi:hypothetical protein
MGCLHGGRVVLVDDGERRLSAIVDAGYADYGDEATVAASLPIRRAPLGRTRHRLSSLAILGPRRNPTPLRAV